MIIINGTKISKSILASNGDIINIPPGGQSQLTIASSYLIRAAMKLGDPTEIGIVINGSYEMQVASSITGSAPYLYTDLNEALSKLIDPNTDYTAKMDNSKNIHVYQDELKGKDETIKMLNSEIADLKSKLSIAEASDLKSDLERQIKTLESENKTLLSEKLRYESQYKESLTQIEELTKTINGFRKQEGERDQQITELNAQIKALSDRPDDSAKYAEELKQLNNKIDELTSQKAAALKNLKDAADEIENMKNSFNACCAKFNIYLDDEGEWQMDKTEN